MRNNNLKEVARVTLVAGIKLIRKKLEDSNYEWDQDVIDKVSHIKFKIVHNKEGNTFGSCWVNLGYFEVYPDSFDYQNIEDFKDTVLHEYCHYLTKLLYDKRGHCKEWKNLCKIIGCDPMATHRK